MRMRSNLVTGGWLVVAALTSVPAWGASVRASSEHTASDGSRHPASAAFDGELATGWAEGEMGDGQGAWIEVRLDRPTPIRSISIWPGDLSKGERTLREHGRPAMITAELQGDGEPTTVEIRLRDGVERGIQRVDVRVDATARTVRFKLDEVYGGIVHNDTYVTEIAFNLLDGDIPGADRLGDWVESSSGERAAAAHKEEVVDRFARIREAQFGDRDALVDLMSWAADGAPFMRSRVARYVPWGFRLPALPPDPLAIEALLKVQDANGIRALRLAASRTTGKTARAIDARADYFQAYVDLQSGGRRGLGLWGETGWEKGALRSFGEPLGIGLGAEGRVYVTDLANHRVTVFSPEGRVAALWGRGEPTVTNTWLGGVREHYAAGASPEDAPGGFTLPLDLAVVQGRADDEILVLDAGKRVQVFGSDGALRKRWAVRAEMDAAPAVGGAGHVLATKGKVVVIWGNEAIVYEADGTELDRWTIEDGAPIAAAALRNGRLLLGFRRRGAKLYGLDGYAFATVIGPDDLPRGYEAWDLTADDKGKIWVVTDNGWAVKYRKPGKEQFRLRWSARGGMNPRAAVVDDVLFVVSGDTVSRLDTVEAREAEAEDDDDGA